MKVRNVRVAAALLIAGPMHAAVAQPASQPVVAEALQRLLSAELARFPGKAGVWVKHLTTGQEAGVRADEMFNSASVIKIPVLVQAMQMADKGTLNLSDRTTITAADFRGGSGIFRYHDPGLQPTLHDVLLQMIITSDNTATDLAIARVGGVSRVNEWIKSSGYGDGMILTQTTADLFAKYGALTVAATRNEKTASDRDYWLGAMTPRSTGHLLEAMARCSEGVTAAPALASRARCTDMMTMLRAQQSGARRLPHFLSVAVGHKTGDFPPMVANDVGIIFARSGPIVVAFFSNEITGNYGEAEDMIGQMARRIVDYFDPPPPLPVKK